MIHGYNKSYLHEKSKWSPKVLLVQKVKLLRPQFGDGSASNELVHHPSTVLYRKEPMHVTRRPEGVRAKPTPVSVTRNAGGVHGFLPVQ